ncbi:MAG: DUF3540 domain-containing protein [Proteobacteria bacterium]|nr:DUF3540 domain-containing protein [Pseudomonadota bacterium]
MSRIAYLRADAEARLETGRIVLSRDENEFIVDVGAIEYQAARAYSCLVRPEVGDTVLVHLDRAVYVLAVLKRPNEGESVQEIAFRGPARLTAGRGPLRISGRDDVAVSSAGRLDLSGQDMSLTAVRAEARFDRLDWVARLVSGQAKRVGLVAEAMDQVVRRAVTRLTESFRYIKGHEEVQAESTRLLVDRTMVVQTGHTMHTAKGHVKIDAEQIHIG